MGGSALGLSVEGDERGLGAAQADAQAFDLAEPSVVAGLADPLPQIGGDLGEAVALARVDAEHGAAHAGVFVLAGAAVGAGAGAEFDLAQGEVLLELAPFRVGGLAVLGLGPDGAAFGQVGAVGPDQLVLEDRDVGLGAGEALVAEQVSRDVDWEPAGDRFGIQRGAQPNQVIWRRSTLRWLSRIR